MIFKTILNIVPRPWLLKLSYLVKPVLAIYYKGNKYTDPIDGKTYRKFLPYGYDTQRENVLAPSTLSLERHRLLWLYLNNETSLLSSKLKVLHIAPEQCFLGKFRKNKKWDYTTADLYSPLADIKADVCDMPFADNTYDLVICNHVLEHIEDDKKAMNELYRVLKRGGTGIFQVPMDYDLESTYEDFAITDPKERTKHFGQYDHVRVYAKDYFKRLELVGFKVERYDISKSLSSEYIEKYRLQKGELLPVCYK
ncbi:MAG: methyltransferase domain-containing protein [Flavobacteriaceae bacterium]|nr:methyltransferase domain-containing protein [Flavobacteriaceae bacterium]